MDEVIKVFTTNAHGLRIVKCCASCEHCGRDETKELARICKIGNGVHSNDYLCEQWEMEKTPRDKQHADAMALKDVMLRPTGNVRKPEYIRFVQERLEELDRNLLNKKKEFAELVKADMEARGVEIDDKAVAQKVKTMLKEYHSRYVSAFPQEYESKHGSRFLVLATEPPRERHRLKNETLR